MQIGIRLAHKGIRIPGLDIGIVALPVDLAGPLGRVFLRKQPVDRLLWREIRIAVIEVAVGKGEVHRLVQRVDVAGAVVPHRLQVEVLEDVEGLQHHGALHPRGELVDLDSFVRGHHGLFDVDLPVGEVVGRDQRAFLPGSPHEFPRDVTLVEPVVRRIDRVLAVLAVGERLPFGLEKFPQRGREVGLSEDLSGAWSFAVLAQVGQVDLARVFPLFDPFFVPLDGVGRLRLDRIALSHLNGWLQHVREAQRAVLGEHDHQPSGRSRRHGRERPVSRRVLQAALPVELDGGPGRGRPERIDTNHLPGVRVVNEGLGFPTPAQGVPHR